jgi:hypothetical protein
MKKAATLGLLLLAAMLSNCGSNNATGTAATVDGTWQAVMVGGSGEASVIDFNTKFTVNNDNSLNVSTINFLTVGTCFVSGATAGGTFTLTSGLNVTPITGNFSFVVQSGSPAGNTLTLTGTEDGTTITGTWTLTGGSGCAGAGDFTMTQSP